MPNATITQAGDVACQALSCSGLTVNTVVHRPYKEIVALASVKSTTVTSGSSFINPWSYTYTSSGGKVKVTVYITCYSSVAGAERQWSIYKNSTVAATGAFTHNNANTHTAMPALIHIDTTGSLTAATWKVYAGVSCVIDTSDTCTMAIAEF